VFPHHFWVLHWISTVSWSQKVKYFYVIINSKLKWNDHCQFIVSKATKCLNHICRAMYGCKQAAKVNAYKALVRPHLEYARAVWSPYMAKDISLLESVQHRTECWFLSFWNLSINWGWAYFAFFSTYFSFQQFFSFLPILLYTLLII